ncbi:cytochrome C oxidase subunit IV [Ruegeria marisrubri]|uniref:Cytochrome C oxidase subunit IV n=1 Tax=Ruegeria marisrubri TaxID=1685379 RepID=A0A0X3TKU1_9RHOB|nr:aa3-type cytochrome c oxidase subunit IV [Ruegeria marisrubri]KUJ76402.1 cytochrome C oxidase subunit IV [Ruegeria marisrubri]
MAEYKHGEMDIKEQTETFNSFVKFIIWSVAAIFFVLLFLAVFAS